MRRKCKFCGTSIHRNTPFSACRSCRKANGLVQKWNPAVQIDRRSTKEKVREAEALLPSVGTGPVEAAPCSALRLAVLIARADAGLPLWDKRDRT